MKKLLFVSLLFAGFNGFSQVLKSDFYALFNIFPYYKMDRIVLSNVRVLDNDSTAKWGVLTYKRKECTFELSEHAFYIKAYKDSLQHVLMNVHVIPFQKIIALSAGDKELKLRLSE